MTGLIQPNRRAYFLQVSVIVLITVLCAVGGYLFGMNLTYSDLTVAKQSIEELRPQSQRLGRLVLEQNARIAELENELTRVRTMLHAIMPSNGTYNISSNQSVIVADGHLTIGLVGSPGNDSINININGKQQTATTGDVIPVTVDQSTNCKVRIQSFDMFKAIVTASCAVLTPN